MAVDRRTIDLSAYPDLVVIYLGMRVNALQGLKTLIGFGLAYLIDRKFRGHGFWTTLILIPMMLSPAVVGNFWAFIYQPQIGLFNYAVSFFTGIAPSSFERPSPIGSSIEPEMSMTSSTE